MVMQIIEATVTLVAIYLIVINSGGFSTSLGAIGNQYVAAVQALQGRPSDNPISR